MCGESVNRERHWEAIYRTRSPTEVSWYQREARRSLELIRRVAGEPVSPIVDVGAGASTLVDGLVAAGYGAVIVVDLAPAALQRARDRLGAAAARVRWMVGDARDLPLPRGSAAVWHDRALFHFLTEAEDRRRYIAEVRRVVRPGGHVIVASFGLEGPSRCSGLDVVRYGADSLDAEFGPGFRLLDSLREDHWTPRGALQPFVYCLFGVESESPDQP